MKDLLYIGRVVGTHGIKGEIRIISDFEYKDKVFVMGNTIIIGDKSYLIRSYRKHKNFDMVTLNDYNNINEVLFLVKSQVFYDKDKLHLNDNEVLDEDLLEFKVINIDGRIGTVLEVFYASSTNKIIRVMLDKEYLVAVNSPMLVSINKSKKTIEVNVLD